MPDPHEVTAFLREQIATHWPQRFDAAELRDDVSLGEDGLGLDSVEVVELLLACEERYDRTAGPELWESVPLSIAAIAGHFAGDQRSAELALE